MKRNISPLNDLISLFNLIILFIKERPNIIHCNTPKVSLIGLLAGYITRVPNRIYYVHGLRYEGGKGLNKKILLNLEKFTLWLATDIIAVSFGTKHKIEKTLTKKRVSLIHNGSPNGMSLTTLLLIIMI
ncbi:MAG: glycosyltransferase [Capnocytophaga sp.]|nr:glycosyltransferase [Capnocytophaga sp.]